MGLDDSLYAYYMQYDAYYMQYDISSPMKYQQTIGIGLSTGTRMILFWLGPGWLYLAEMTLFWPGFGRFGKLSGAGISNIIS